MCQQGGALLQPSSDLPGKKPGCAGNTTSRPRTGGNWVAGGEVEQQK